MRDTTQNPSWSKALKTAQDTYKLAPAFAMAIIYQESKFKAEAKSKGSSAYGHAQAIDGTWLNLINVNFKKTMVASMKF